MTIKIEHQLIRDKDGNPVFVVLPYGDFQRLTRQTVTHSGIPEAVLALAMENNWSAMRAWREYKGLTQKEVADLAGITQSAYSQHENSQRLRKSTRVKLAEALGVELEQLAF